MERLCPSFESFLLTTFKHFLTEMNLLVMVKVIILNTGVWNLSFKNVSEELSTR